MKQQVGTNRKLCPDSFFLYTGDVSVSRLGRLSDPLVSSALIPWPFRRLTWHSQNTITIITVQFFLPYLVGALRKAGRGKSRTCLQVNLLVSRRHAGCKGTIDNRRCSSLTGKVQTNCRKRHRHVVTKTESVLGRCVGHSLLV